MNPADDTASPHTETSAAAQHITDAAVQWLRTQHHNLYTAADADSHDQRLASVVQTYRIGGVTATVVEQAVREWRTHITDSQWLDAVEAELIRLVDPA